MCVCVFYIFSAGILIFPSRSLTTHSCPTKPYLHALGKHPELKGACVRRGAEQERALGVDDGLRLGQPLAPGFTEEVGVVWRVITWLPGQQAV